MIMSNKLDEFEELCSDIRNYICDKILSLVMKSAVSCVSSMKGCIDNDSLLKVKTMSDKIFAEFAAEM